MTKNVMHGCITYGTPQTLVAGKPGERFTIQVEFLEGRKHLPIVTLKRAA